MTKFHRNIGVRMIVRLGLHEKLQPVKLSDLPSTILGHRKQLENEPVITVQRLVKELYPELNPEAKNVVLFRQFRLERLLNGLKISLSDKVIGSNPSTFQEALAKARQYRRKTTFCAETPLGWSGALKRLWWQTQIHKIGKKPIILQ